MIYLQGPLHFASQYGHDLIIAFLLDNNADVNKKDSANMTPMHYAIKKKLFSTCKLILEYDKVSTQAIKSGIKLARSIKAPGFRTLLEKRLKSRSKVILVCVSSCDLTRFIDRAR